MSEVGLKKKGKSICWNYFGFLYKDGKLVEPDRYYCTICLEADIEHGYHDTASTTNMIQHLNQKHKSKISEKPKTTPEINRFFTCIESAKSLTARDTIIEKSHKKSSLETEKCLDFCLKSFMPLDIFENSGFRSIMKSKIGFSEVSLDHISAKTNNLKNASVFLDEKFNIKKKEIMKVLSKSHEINICLNYWRHRNKKIYIETVVFFLDDMWHLQNVALPIITLPTDAENDDMVDAVCSNLESFNLADKAAIITSNCNISLSKKIACEEIFCFMTVLQETYSKFCGQELVNNAIKKVFKNFYILQFLDDRFEDYAKNKVLIVEIQKKADFIRKMVNILFYNEMEPECQSKIYSFSILPRLLQFFLDNRRDITNILISIEKQSFCLEKNDLKSIEDVLALSNVFVENVKILPSFPRISLTPIVLEEIANSLYSLKQEKISSACNKFLDDAVEFIKTKSKLTKFQAAAMIADPSTFKSKQLDNFFTSQDIDMTEFLQTYVTKSSDVTETALETTKQPRKQKNITALIRKNMTAKNSSKTNFNLLDYGDEDFEEVSVFDWWAKNYAKYPRIERMVRKYLPVSGSSTGINLLNENQLNIYYKKSTFSTFNLKKISFISEN